MSYLQLFQCDGCERKTTIEDALASGGWMQLMELVNEETHVRRVERISQGELSDAKSGHFCSLRCLEGWASRGQELEDIERRFDQ